MPQKWSKEEISTLYRYAGVKNCTEIGALIGKTKASVIQKARRLRLPLPRGPIRRIYENDTEIRQPYLAEYCRGKGHHQVLLRREEDAWQKRKTFYVVRA